MAPALTLLSGLLASSSSSSSSSSSDTAQQHPDLLVPVPRIFIGGLGYCGARIARTFLDSYGPQCAISGTVRSAERRDALLSSPPSWLLGPGDTKGGEGGDGGKIRIHVLDLDEHYGGLSPEGLHDLSMATHVVQTVAPIADYDRDPLLALHGDVLRRSTSLQYVGYLSSTGVYGDHDGGWVTEDEATSELRCRDDKSMARVVAEREWGELETETGPRVDFFRCGGIYGPGRGPIFSSLSALDEALTSGEEETTMTPKYVNRILVDDICGALLAAFKGDRPRYPGKGRAYNLVDDDPAPRRDVVAEARRLLSELEDSTNARSSSAAETSPPSEPKKKGATKKRRRRISRNTGNKRCGNARLKEEYGWELVAPTYREGLKLLLEQRGRE